MATVTVIAKEDLCPGESTEIRMEHIGSAVRRLSHTAPSRAAIGLGIDLTTGNIQMFARWTEER